jgi:hypothetical protein
MLRAAWLWLLVARAAAAPGPQELVDWFLAAGGAFHASVSWEFTQAADGWVGRAHARTPIRPSEASGPAVRVRPAQALVRVPPTLLMLADPADALPPAQAALPAEERLALRVMREWNLGAASPWATYLAAMRSRQLHSCMCVLHFPPITAARRLRPPSRCCAARSSSKSVVRCASGSQPLCT